ncbi:SEFIR domain-containing protein [Bacillus rhizoplanae]|uniref:SEFIR domain-containing protein n=1 Tax=Bacillus rhizoplanae TaxID=2880966 RepID=UPI003D20ADAB
MNQQALVNPRVFISYSWTTPEHEEWVVELATRLMHNGINVVLDKWDLKEGQDIYAFMESMVNSDSVDKVLIICDKGYQEKADNRVGGVGTETQIITPQIYKDVQQEKFIPIVAERDERGNHFIPTYIATRLYIDLSLVEFYEDNYEKLIRNIYKVPLFKKPSLGKPPEYLFQDEAPHFQTALVLRQMKVASDKYPNRIRYLWNSFTDAFSESLKELNIKEVKDSNELDEQIIKKINESIPLRNDFINALELLCMTENIEAEQIIEFFEKIFAFSEFQGSGTYYEGQCDQYKFLINEIFLYSVTILLKERKYSLLSQVLNVDYYVDSKYRGDRHANYTDFRFSLGALEYRNQKLKLNRLSLHADLIVERAYRRYKDDIISTDLILYYVSKMNKHREFSWARVWFPTTYIYFTEAGTIKLLSRLKSKNHFSNVKILFNVDTESELKKQITEFESDRGYSGSWHNLPNIREFITPEDICTLP